MDREKSTAVDSGTTTVHEQVDSYADEVYSIMELLDLARGYEIECDSYYRTGHSIVGNHTARADYLAKGEYYERRSVDLGIAAARLASERNIFLALRDIAAALQALVPKPPAGGDAS